MQGDKRVIFERYRRSQIAAGLGTDYAEALVCPLCWQETGLNDLSVEHVVPGSIGGLATVLTCRKCNNEHGSSLDSHLAQYQKIQDAFRGHGTIPTELNVNGKRLVANLEWTEGSKNFRVVGKATDPRVNDLVKADFQAGLVKELQVTLSFGYSKNQFDRAVLRAAYLVLFKHFGYEYVAHEVVQILRRRICDPSQTFPRLGSMILEFRNPNNLPEDRPYLITGGDVSGVKFLLVILRAKKATITYLGAFMPHSTAPIDTFYELMEQCSREHNGKRLTIPAGDYIT